MSLHISAFLLVLTLSFVNAVDDDQSTLQFVFTMFRHGHRTNDLVTVYPNDPFINATYFPYGYGQLTNQGKMRQYKLGKMLRRKYSEFLGMYVPSQVDAWSTELNRTKTSLLLVLAGLYPPKSPLNWNNNLNWQPIPYNIIPLSDFRVAMPQWACKRHALLYEKFKTSAEGIALEDQYRSKYAYVSEHTGLHVKSIYDLYLLFSALTIEKDFGYVLPDWTEEIFPAYLENAAIDFYISITDTPELKRLAGGFLLKMLVDTFSQKINNTINPPDKKILIYSAHEFNIAIFLRCLNVFERQFPAYGEAVMLELHLVDSLYGVKLYHQDWTAPRPKLLTIPGCDTFCPFEQFKNIASGIFPTDSNICNYIEDI